MYVSCSCLVCAKKDYPTVEDALAKVRELGFGSFDLDAFENWQHVNPSELAAGGSAAVERLAAAIAASGLRAGSFNCGMSRPISEADAGAFEQYKREFAALLDLAKRVGCANLTIQPGSAGESDDDADALLKLVAERAAELCAMARPRGISVGLEAHQGSLLEKPAAALRMAAELCPAVGITYDPSHLVMQGIALPEAEALLDHAVHVHVRNASRGNMQATMADGTVDFAWLVAALKRRGYQGPLAIEYFNAFDADFTNTLALRDLLVELGVEG